LLGKEYSYAFRYEDMKQKKVDQKTVKQKMYTTANKIISNRKCINTKIPNK